VRRDLADAFCTARKASRARARFKWRLVDQAVPNSKFEQAHQGHGQEAQPAIRPVERCQGRRAWRRSRAPSRTVPSPIEPEVEIDRDARRATLTLRAPRARLPPRRKRCCRKAPASGRLRLARELDDAILHLRLNEPEIGVLIFKSQGEPAQVAGVRPVSRRQRGPLLAREILQYWKRVLKRVDMTSRSLVAQIGAGS
jgi:benzoyl-CoA-dihydrodiol lyase